MNSGTRSRGRTVKAQTAANRPSGPVAPAVYRPQQLPKVLQTKMAGPLSSARTPAGSRGRAAPAVYRPQPTPRVLQTKRATPEATVMQKPMPATAPSQPRQVNRVVQPKAL